MEEVNKQEIIHEKGFDMINGPATDYNKMKIGLKTVQDAVLELGTLKDGRREFYRKKDIMHALADRDLRALRAISNYFYRTNGIYQKVVDYFATMYRFDWYIVPDILDENTKEEKVLKEFVNILNYLDNSYIKKVCSDIALKVIKDGAYYGYIIPSDNGLILQELPIDYCRVRYMVGNLPAVEFDMSWFDTRFTDVNYRMRVLDLFPDDFKKGYLLYKKGRLPADPDPWNIMLRPERPWNDTWINDSVASSKYGRWYLLDPGSVIKFDLGPGRGDLPLFVNAVPSIIDLDEAQGLDRQKQAQDLLRIIVQKLPLDKNGDLIFDVDEAKDIHNNAVMMLKRAVGVDVLTTFADIEVADLRDNNSVTKADDLEKVERTVYNNSGISQDVFNASGNIAVTNSILNDESSIRDLILRLNSLFNRIVGKFSKKNHIFKFDLLETT